MLHVEHAGEFPDLGLSVTTSALFLPTLLGMGLLQNRKRSIFI